MRDEELTAAIREVQARAKARVPQGELGLSGVAVPNLLPLVHARDAAESKVAAIGSVNPRPAGLANSLIQSVKRSIARALEWFVRDQVEFNRASIGCVQASLEALTELNRAVAALASHHQSLREQFEAERADLSRKVNDVTAHWAEWRPGFEDRRNASEIHMLRTISELQGAFQHRVTLLEQNFRDLVARQHREFTTELAGNTADVQQRLWADLQRVRTEYDALIHTELRLLRQKGISAAPPATASAPAVDAPEIPIDWARFAEVFRGSEDRIRAQQQRYAQRFQGAIGDILDIGCGRGEFLEIARAAGVSARGIDSNAGCVAECLAKGLSAEQGDLFAYLESLPDGSLGGAMCSQVVEHMPAALLPRLVNLLGRKVRTGGVVVFETPNPECLAIFATHFYIDPTHTRPVPAVLLRFYCEEAGFGGMEIEPLYPAADSLPAVADLPASVQAQFFSGMDYALTARRL